MSTLLQDLLATRHYLLADGGTGTNLFDMGLQTGDAPELWNIEAPEKIAELHRSFIEAGSDIILTNTFGGTRYRMKLHNAQDRVAEINIAAAKIARAEAEAAGRPVVVAGSMGPTGEILEPVGTVSVADVEEAFAEQALALAEGGVDVLWVETLSSREELEAALAGAARAGLPTVCTLSFDTNGRTMMGITPAELKEVCQTFNPHPAACGSNCGVGASELVAALLNMNAQDDPDIVLVAKANCGIPEYVDGKIRYNGTPEIMADYARLARDAGARIIGGCCGTTAEHLRAMKAVLDDYTPGERPSIDTVAARLGEVTNGSRAQARGEMSREQGAADGAKARRPSRRRPKA